VDSQFVSALKVAITWLCGLCKLPWAAFAVLEAMSTGKKRTQAPAEPGSSEQTNINRLVRKAAERTQLADVRDAICYYSTAAETVWKSIVPIR
jgi:hypothetical protein